MTRFRELRESKGVKQQVIADLLGVTRAAYSNIENEKRQLGYSQLELLSRYYSVSIDYLLGSMNSPKGAAVSEFADDEIELIHLYRQLSPEGRFEVSRFVEYASDRYKKDNRLPDVEAK